MVVGLFEKNLSNYMSIYRDRLIRYITRDMYLPWSCYASKYWMFSPLGYCNCVLDCKFLKTK